MQDGASFADEHLMLMEFADGPWKDDLILKMAHVEFIFENSTDNSPIRKFVAEYVASTVKNKASSAYKFKTWFQKYPDLGLMVAENLGEKAGNSSEMVQRLLKQRDEAEREVSRLTCLQWE
jgi:hypothetical protein